MEQDLYNKILNVKNIKELPEEKIYDDFFCSMFSLNILSLLTIIPINMNGFTSDFVLVCIFKYNPKNFYKIPLEDFNWKIK